VKLTHSRVSVVIPTWNEHPQIAKLLDSLKAQTLPPWETIVVDKKSTDGTGQYAESVGSKVIYDMGNVATARNTGAKVCSGDIVAFTEADTIVPKEWIEAIASKFEGDLNLLAVAGPGIPYSSRDVPLSVAFEYWLYNRFRALMGRFGVFMCSGYNMAVRREVLDRIHFPDIVPNDDGLFGRMVSRTGKTFFASNIYVHISSRRFEKLGFIQANLYYLFMLENISPLFDPITNILRARSAKNFDRSKG